MKQTFTFKNSREWKNIDGQVSYKKRRTYYIQLKKLFTIAIILCVFTGLKAEATSYYVSPSGNDNNNGLSLGTAFATCYKVAPLVNPGDIVWFADGVYTNQDLAITRSGTNTAYITFKAINAKAAKITNTWGNCITIGSSTAQNVGYIIIDGFELYAPATYGSGVASGYGAHHITVKNCWAHDCGQSGIQLNDGDYRVIENNICNNNGYLMPEAGSGISLWGMKSFDSNSGWHSIIRNNICFGNINGPTTANTDGNGIIIDDFRNTQGGHTAGIKNVTYTGNETLVEGNLCYYNGGAGIQIYITNNVTVQNNTVYLNQRRRTNETWRGNMSISCCHNVKTINNISVVSSAQNFDGGSNWSYFQNNSAYGAFALSGDQAGSNYTYYNNLSYDINATSSNSINSSGITVSFDGTNANKAATNPLFVSPGITAAANFRLQSSSPCINAGTANFGLGTFDLDNNPRINGIVDMGAYETTTSTAIVVTGGSVNPTSAALLVGGTQQLTATIAPSDATNKNVSWSSSNPAVASVNASGLLTAVTAGSAVVTVTTQDGGKTATCLVSVTNNGGGTLSDLTVQAETYCASSGVTTYGTLVGEWSIGDYTKYCSINLSTGYSTLKMRLATLQSGSFNIRLGSTTGTLIGTINFSPTGSWETYQDFTCTLTGATGTNDIFIVANGTANFDYLTFTGGTTTIPVTGITLNSTSASLIVGATQQLTATVLPVNATNKNVNWSTSNPAIATVSASGLLTAVSVGNATITATTQDGGKTATCSVTVTVPATNIHLEAENYNSKSSGTVVCSTCTPVYAGEFWNGGWIAFNNVNLASGYNNLSFRFATTRNGSLEVRKNSATGTLLGSYNFSNTGGYSNFVVQNMVLTGASGVQTIYIKVKNNSSLNLDYIEFTNAPLKGTTININSDDWSEKFTLFPNNLSTNEILTIQNNNCVPVSIKMFDNNGRIVYKNRVNSTLTINMAESAIKQGFYLVHIESATELIRKKLLVTE
jgi:parallel beta-helix repeat protein